MEKIYIDGNSLTLTDFIKVARHNYKIDLTESAKEEVERSRRLVEKFVNSNKTIYGITTGFGKFSEHIINKEESKRLQRNLIVSHACGVGHPLKEEYVRGIILLRINALAKGYSGIRLSTLNTLIEMLNKGIHPIIPEKGSLGASGDLAPLAHMALVFIGKGEAIYKGQRMSGQEAME
ncbi:MAG TPA: aromatic amino acid lyase, partial [Tissierellaceae bacterium]|nr:aromatic amino acid lyase [Tissierellaceae bacterium]